MSNKIEIGVLKKYIPNGNMVIWKIEDSTAASNIYVEDKDEELLSDLDINTKVYFKLKKVFLGKEFGQNMYMALAYNLRFEINTNKKI